MAETSTEQKAATKSPPRRGLGRVSRSGKGGWLGQLAALVAWVAVIAMIGVAASGASLSAPPAALAVAIALLPYLFATLFGMLAVLGLLYPARRSFPLLMIVVAGVSAFWWFPRTTQAAPPADGTPLRMATWNVRRLWGGPADGGDAAACVVDVLKAEDVDVVTLLEVSAADIDALSSALGMSCVHHPYTSEGDRKAGGLAACARGEVKLLGGKGQRYVDEDDWFYVTAEASASGQRFNVVAAHLFPYRYVASTIERAIDGLVKGDATPMLKSGRAGELVAKSQSDHAAALLDRIDRFEDPTLIGGDFNSTRDSALHVSLRRRLTDAWPAGGSWYGPTVFLFDLLPLRVDYVYETPQFHTLGTWVPAVGCSDHRPVVTDVVLSP